MDTKTALSPEEIASIEQTVREMRREGRLDEALELGITKLGEFNNENAITYNWIASSHSFSGRFLKANSFLRKKLRIYYKLIGHNHLDIAWTFEAIGENYRMAGNFDKAREYYTKAIALLQKLYGPCHKYIAAVYDHMAESFVDEGNIEVATQWFDNEISNLRSSEGNKGRDISDVFLRLTDLYIERKDQIAAKRYCDQGLKESKSPLKMARFYQRLGMIARESGDHNTALRQFKRELTCYKNAYMPFEPDLGRAYLSVGSELNALGEYDKAKVNLQKGLKMYQHLLELRVNNPDADPDVVGETFDYVGLFLIELDDIKGGIDHFKKAIQYYGPRSKKAAYLRQYIKDIKKAVSK